MKTLHMHEFERHLEKAHLKTQYIYTPNGDRVPPEMAGGWITNELITRGASFQTVATFCHPKGMPSLADVRPFSTGKSCLDHIGFHLLDDSGSDADIEEVCSRVAELRPDLMEFDASVLGAEDAQTWVRVDRNDYRTYCLQAPGCADLVFDGVILEWDYIEDDEAEHPIWTERTKYRSARGAYIALKEKTAFQDGRPISSNRMLQIFPTEEEADDFLYEEDIEDVVRDVGLLIEGGMISAPTELEGNEFLPSPQ